MAINVLSPNKFAVPSTLKDEARLAMLAAAQTDNPFTPGHWSQSLLIRICIGMLITTGVTFALMRLTDLILMWMTPVEEFWKSMYGFITWQGLQLVGTFFGGMMAAAGRYQMTTVGLMLGVMIGFATMILIPNNPNIPSALYFVMPAWFMVSGGIGAWFGDKFWHPQYRRAPRVLTGSKLSQNQQDASVAQLIRQAVLGMIFANVHWLRIILAVLIIIPTLWFTQSAVNWLLIKLGLTAWAAEVGLQKAWLVTMIKIIIVVLCAAMTGAGTNHGIAHGFWTGVFCGVINLLLHVFIPKDPNDALPVDAILWEVGWVFLLCIACGGFGALVIPPMMYLAQKRRPASLR